MGHPSSFSEFSRGGDIVCPGGVLAYGRLGNDVLMEVQNDTPDFTATTEHGVQQAVIGLCQREIAVHTATMHELLHRLGQPPGPVVRVHTAAELRMVRPFGFDGSQITVPQMRHSLRLRHRLPDGADTQAVVAALLKNAAVLRVAQVQALYRRVHETVLAQLGRN